MCVCVCVLTISAKVWHAAACMAQKRSLHNEFHFMQLPIADCFYAFRSSDMAEGMQWVVKISVVAAFAFSVCKTTICIQSG